MVEPDTCAKRSSAAVEPGACANCGSGRSEPFYEVRGIPVHSTILLRTRQEALDFPRGDLALGFCRDCGFVQNLLFDPTVQAYSTNCEESQGFSETFNRFARELAQEWIDRYDLRGKRILEIGCGKGEFLVQLCELGGNSGIGIDPTYVPERTVSPAASRIRFIQDLYSEKYAHLEADFICCRHTLEHIQPTLEFMRTVRRAVGPRTEVVLGFELPDISRVLKEQAFWDIYYEHCSYFSLGSLARLFRATGFDVLHLAKCYGDQYLLIDGRLAGGAPARRFAAEDDLDELAADVLRFRSEVPRRLAAWRDLLGRAHAEGKRTVVWGSSSKGVSFLTTLGITDEVGLVTDINPFRQNMHMAGSGHRIVPPRDLVDYRPDLVIAMNPIYLAEIRADLGKMGLAPELHAV